jgi:hypothetical protein
MDKSQSVCTVTSKGLFRIELTVTVKKNSKKFTFWMIEILINLKDLTMSPLPVKLPTNVYILRGFRLTYRTNDLYTWSFLTT